jgi:hypothetical protein
MATSTTPAGAPAASAKPYYLISIVAPIYLRAAAN